MIATRDLKKDLNEFLRELQLSTIRRCFEEKARQAERETLGYEQYLLELTEVRHGQYDWSIFKPPDEASVFICNRRF